MLNFKILLSVNKYRKGGQKKLEDYYKF